MQVTTDQRAFDLLVKLLIVLAIIALMVLGKAVLVPLGYALLLAMVLHPMVGYLEKRKVPRWLAITFALSSVGLLMVAFAALLLDQFHRFMEQLPQLTGSNVSTGLSAIYPWIEDQLRNIGVLPEEGLSVVSGAFPIDAAGLTSRVLNTVLGSLFNLFIIPVFTALLLYHRHTYVAIVLGLSSDKARPQVHQLIHGAARQHARFILGMIQVYLIVGALNSLGFLILGVPYPFLFGMLTAVMTMIPYVGIFVSALLPISLAYTSTGSFWMPIGVIGVLAVVQYLEANLIFPKVVGGKLGLSTLASLLSIFMGGLIWGVAGMILFLPLVSILKMIGTVIPSWRPWMLFLGDQAPGPDLRS